MYYGGEYELTHKRFYISTFLGALSAVLIILAGCTPWIDKDYFLAITIIVTPLFELEMTMLFGWRFKFRGAGDRASMMYRNDQMSGRLNNVWNRK